MGLYYSKKQIICPCNNLPSFDNVTSAYIYKDILADILNLAKEHNNIINTTFYKIKKEDLIKLHDYLIKHLQDMEECIQYEVLIYCFMKTLDKYKIIDDYKGISGLISVDGSKLNI